MAEEISKNRVEKCFKCNAKLGSISGIHQGNIYCLKCWKQITGWKPSPSNRKGSSVIEGVMQ